MNQYVRLLAGSKFIVDKFDGDDNVVAQVVHQLSEDVTVFIPHDTYSEPVLTINKGK